jgi:hypothetical protein
MPHVLHGRYPAVLNLHIQADDWGRRPDVTVSSCFSAGAARSSHAQRG